MNDNISKSNSKISISELLIYLYFIIMFGARAIGILEGSLTYNVVLLLGAVLIFGRLLSVEYSIFELLVIGIILILAAVSYLLSGEKGIILYLVFMFGLKNINSRNMLRIAVVISGISFPVMAFLALSGIRHDTIWYIRRGVLGNDDSAIIRWSLGYSHSNVCHIVFLILCAMILYFTPREKSKLLFNSIVLAILNIVLYFYTYSRTGFLGVFALILLHAYYMHRGHLSIVDKVIAVSLYPFIAFISVLLPYFIEPGNLYNIINKLTSERLSKAYNFVHGSSIPLFGQRLDLSFATMLDNSYLYLLGQNGFIIALIMLVINVFTVMYLIKTNRLKTLALVLIIQIAGYMEPFMYNLSFRNVAFIFYGEAFFYYLSKLQKRLGYSFLNNQVRIIKLDRNIDGLTTFFEKIYFDLKDVISNTYNVIGRMLGVAITVALVSLVVFRIISPWPNVVYSCDENYVNFEDQIEYFTESEVESIEESGGIVINYKDSITPVYEIPYDYGYIYYLLILTKGLGVLIAVLLVQIIIVGVTRKIN